MLEVLGNAAATPFAVALIVMIVISLLEGLSMVFGMGLSGLVDGLLPDFDMPEVDAPDIETDGVMSAGSLDSVGPLTHMMSWLSFGKAPALILLIAFLTVFGLSGLTIQAVVHGLTGLMVPGWLAAIPAVMIALPGTRYAGRGFAAIMPSDQTEAVSGEGFVGKVAVIIRGTAKRGMPAEAKLKDVHGLTHWVLVEPDEDAAEFKTGEDVIIVSRAGSIYRTIKNTHAVLSRP
jgi:hypothetical protein